MNSLIGLNSNYIAVYELRYKITRSEFMSYVAYYAWTDHVSWWKLEHILVQKFECWIRQHTKSWLFIQWIIKSGSQLRIVAPHKLDHLSFGNKCCLKPCLEILGKIYKWVLTIHKTCLMLFNYAMQFCFPWTSLILGIII